MIKRAVYDLPPEDLQLHLKETEDLPFTELEINKDTSSKVPLLMVSEGKIQSRKNSKKGNRNIPEWTGCFSSQELICLINEKILPKLPEGSEVKVLTQFSKAGVKYSANPCYGAKRVARQDWAISEYTYTSNNRRGQRTQQVHKQYVPVHLLCVLEITTEPMEPIIMDSSGCRETGTISCKGT
jgi:hypothetical protein